VGSRRELLLRASALGVALVGLDAVRGAPAASAATDLSVLGWGGAYQDALAKWVNAPFRSATGAKVAFQAQGKAAQSLAKIQTEKANPTVDVWLTTAALPLLLAKSGGLEELTVEKIPNLANVAPVAVQKYQGKVYAAGIHLQANLLIVDRERIKTFIPNYTPAMLKSWTFLYRPELKNQVGLGGFEGQYGASSIVITKPYGGSEYQEEKFFAAMRKVAPNVHMIKPGSVGWVQPFLSKEVVAAEGDAVDAAALLKAGAPVDVAAPLDPLSIVLDYVVVIKNGPAGADLAIKYVNEMLQPSVAGPYCSEIGSYSPNRRAVVTPPRGMPVPSPDEISKGWLINYDVAIANYDKWNERYKKEVIPLFGR
jgi:putative spermidine/putrescine transport system substrate-binding protein